MDQKSDLEARLDRILEGQIKRAFRIQQMPDEFRALLRENKLADIPSVRFTRLNPERRRRAEQLVVRAYQKDLRDPDILSNAQVLKLVTERGEWSPELDVQLKTLSAERADLMSTLYTDGIKTGISVWWDELVEKTTRIREAVAAAADWPEDDRVVVLALFNRWLDFTNEKQATYDVQFAASQHRATYSHDSDLSELIERMMLVSETLPQTVLDLELLLEKVRRFQRMVDVRQQEDELRRRYLRMFADTVETRRDSNEEIARLYVTCERMTTEEEETAMPAGPLAPAFEGVFGLPTEVLTWLLEESHFFHANIPEEARDYLETFGFLGAGRTSTDTDSPPSDVSPAPQSSSPDSPVATDQDESFLA